MRLQCITVTRRYAQQTHIYLVGPLAEYLTLGLTQFYKFSKFIMSLISLSCDEEDIFAATDDDGKLSIENLRQENANITKLLKRRKIDFDFATDNNWYSFLRKVRDDLNKRKQELDEMEKSNRIITRNETLQVRRQGKQRDILLNLLKPALKTRFAIQEQSIKNSEMDWEVSAWRDIKNVSKHLMSDEAETKIKHAIDAYRMREAELQEQLDETQCRLRDTMEEYNLHCETIVPELKQFVTSNLSKIKSRCGKLKREEFERGSEDAKLMETEINKLYHDVEELQLKIRRLLTTKVGNAENKLPSKSSVRGSGRGANSLDSNGTKSFEISESLTKSKQNTIVKAVSFDPTLRDLQVMRAKYQEAVDRIAEKKRQLLKERTMSTGQLNGQLQLIRDESLVREMAAKKKTDDMNSKVSVTYL